MSFLALPLAVAGVGLQAIGQVQQARAERQAQEHAARVSEMQAEQARKAGEIEKARLRRDRDFLMGRQKALFAKAGLALTGSPLEVLADTAAQFEKDIAVTRFNTEVARQRYLHQAEQRRFAGRQAQRAGFLQAGATLLTGGVDIHRRF